MTIPTDQTPEARRYLGEDGTACVCVILNDEAGLPHEVFVDEHDWHSALAVTPSWRIVHRYEPSVPLVIASGAGTLTHPERSKRDDWLRLANLIMEPPERETVRFLDGNPCNLVKFNLAVRPKGARTIPKKGKAAITAADLQEAREREVERREEMAYVRACWEEDTRTEEADKRAKSQKAKAAMLAAAKPSPLLQANLAAMAAFNATAQVSR